MKFLLTGGVPRFMGEFKSHGKALKHGEIALLDFDSGQYKTCFTYETPPEYCPDNEPSIGFTSASIYERKIYLATSTQVLVVNLDSFSIEQTINHNLFHDIHHVKRIDEYIYVVNTGMDAVLRFATNGDFIDGINVLGDNLWNRFKQDEELRKITTTKPHPSHPNFLFTLEKEIWVTRFEQRDAACLHRPNERISIDVERPHDGLVKGGLIYFTTVNGNVIIADALQKKVVKMIDLNELDPRKGRPLGWCRGIYVSDKHIYVGFTQLRSTAITDNVKWIKSIIEKKGYVGKPLPTRISRYDVATLTYVDEVQLPIGKITALFSILPFETT